MGPREALRDELPLLESCVLPQSSVQGGFKRVKITALVRVHQAECVTEAGRVQSIGNAGEDQYLSACALLAAAGDGCACLGACSRPRLLPPGRRASLRKTCTAGSRGFHALPTFGPAPEVCRFEVRAASFADSIGVVSGRRPDRPRAVRRYRSQPVTHLLLARTSPRLKHSLTI